MTDLFIDVPEGAFVEKVVKPYTTGHEVRPKSRHIQYGETELRCTSRRCGSPTYVRVSGMPKCNTHAIMELIRIINRLESANE